MTSPLRPGKGGLLLSVRATPKSSRDEVTGLYRDPNGAVSLAVKVTAAPDKGRANRAVIETVAAWAGVPKSRLSLASGETERHKVLLLEGESTRLAERVAELMNGNGNSHGEDH